MIPTHPVKLVGKGNQATSDDGTWDLFAGYLFQCPECFDFLSPTEMAASGSCDCGNLFLDYDLLRFGADSGNDSIRVYEIDTSGGDGTILRDDKRMYELRAEDGIYVIKVVCGHSSSLYWKTFPITQDQCDEIFEEGKPALNTIAFQLSHQAPQAQGAKRTV